MVRLTVCAPDVALSSWGPSKPRRLALGASGQQIMGGTHKDTSLKQVNDY